MSRRSYSTNSPSAENFARPAGQDERVDRNRQAAAMYAADAAERGGGSVPAHLQQYLPGGPAYDASRERDTVVGRIVGGASDALGNLFGGSSASASLAPDRSLVPVMRGTPMPQMGFVDRTMDAFRGNRPFVGMGGAINFEGFPTGSGGGMPFYGGGEDTQPFSLPGSAAPVAMPAPDLPQSPAAESDPGLLFPNLAALSAPQVAFDPASQFTFEEYLAQLQGGGGGLVSPPPVAPIAMNQGIMSLPPMGLMG